MVASVVGMYYTVLVTGSRDIVASAVGIHCTVLVTCSRDIVASAVGTHCTVLVPHCRVVWGTSSACSSGQLLVCIGLVIIFLLRTLYSNTQSSAMLRYDILVTAKYDAQASRCFRRHDASGVTVHPLQRCRVLFQSIYWKKKKGGRGRRRTATGPEARTSNTAPKNKCHFAKHA